MSDSYLYEVLELTAISVGEVVIKRVCNEGRLLKVAVVLKTVLSGRVLIRSSDDQQNT